MRMIKMGQRVTWRMIMINLKLLRVQLWERALEMKPSRAKNILRSTFNSITLVMMRPRSILE